MHAASPCNTFVYFLLNPTQPALFSFLLLWSHAHHTLIHRRCKSQCVYSFSEWLIAWIDVHYHQRLGLSLPTWLQQHGQLGLTIWNVLVLWGILWWSVRVMVSSKTFIRSLSHGHIKHLPASDQPNQHAQIMSYRTTSTIYSPTPPFNLLTSGQILSR